MMIELKPCPFCGGDDIREECDEFGDWRIICHGCSASMPAAVKCDAIEWWNHRIEPEAADRGVSEAEVYRTALQATERLWWAVDARIKGEIDEAVFSTAWGAFSASRAAIQSLRSEQEGGQ